MTKNRIHQFLDRNHVKIPNVTNLFGKTGRRFLNDLDLSGIDAKLLKDHLDILDELHEHIKKTEDWINEVLKDNPLISILDTLPGFGKIFSALPPLQAEERCTMEI